MDSRAAKLAIARKKLKDHQEKKSNSIHDVPATEYNNKPTENIVEEIIITDILGPDNLMYECKSNCMPNINIARDDKVGSNVDQKPADNLSNINITDLLLFDKTNLDMKIIDLQTKLSQLELNYVTETEKHSIAKQKICTLESDLNNIYEKFSITTEENTLKEEMLKELKNLNKSLTDDNNHIKEQLEFTKSILRSKETENVQLQNQVHTLQNQIEAVQLQLQQLTNDSTVNVHNECKDQQTNLELFEKIASLEQQVESFSKERRQMNSHYELYVGELNAQLRAALQKNEEMEQEIQRLSNRENSLIEQISDMEIRLQSYHNRIECLSQAQPDSDIIKNLQQKLSDAEIKLHEMSNNYTQLQVAYEESLEKVQELNEKQEIKCNHDNISIEKLTADITSDKIAAQRATEQNKKLKINLENLEQDFMKMSKDKLELTEKLTHENFLNKDLMLKLADVEEKFKYLQEKITAKDEEMIRLLTSYRDIEKKYDTVLEEINCFRSNIPSETCKTDNQCVEDGKEVTEEINVNVSHNLYNDQNKSEVIVRKHANSEIIPKDDAMQKLQERFLNIMDEVANLSDEKHRLEHIILQLQNETDTICEYVALYQQQRSLLKRRDEERNTQIKIFQLECDQLRHQLQELSELLNKFAEDKELSMYFKEESRHVDIAKVKSLLENLQNSSLINPKYKNQDLKHFYPCSCCSGQLIDV